MTSVYTRAFAMGIVCGMRSMLGPALVAQQSSSVPKWLFGLLSAGELVGDKLPKTPSRLAPGPLVGRLVSGAGVAFVLCRRAGQSPVLGVLLGAAGALTGAYGGFHARRALDKSLGVPDAVVAAGEDALALAIGRQFAL